MKLLKMSDKEISNIAEPIRQDVIDGSNGKDWTLHSKHMPRNVVENDEIKKDAERQWREDENRSSPRTSLSRKAEFFGITRKNDSVGIHWTLTSTRSGDEYLLSVELREIDGEIWQIGAQMH